MKENLCGLNSSERFVFFEELVSKYNRQIYNLAYRLTGNSTEAKDLAQETLVKVCCAFKKYQPSLPFENWLYRIMLNAYIDKLRKRQRMKVESLEIKPEYREEHRQINIPDFTQNPEKLLEREELNICMQAAINSLPSSQRQVIILVDIEGLPYQQVGEILRCPLGTVKSRVYRAHKTLREMLKPYIETGEIVFVS